MSLIRITLICLISYCIPTFACAPVPTKGGSVQIASEEAIIIWDSANQTQHFIRRASFDTKTDDFAFLVPTPTKPLLAEADDFAFDYLEKITAPRKIYRKSWWEFFFSNNKPKAAAKAARVSSAAASPVIVLERVNVGGYDAAVLEASDAGALDSWLKRNEYVSNPALIEWYKPYIAAKWKITAFKIASKGAGGVTSSAIRMSFSTKQPFFPYSEPKSTPPAVDKSDRLLRVFLLADTRFEGILGTHGQWSGKTVWSGNFDEMDQNVILTSTKFPKEQVKSIMDAKWLTEFEDSSSVRLGTDDIYFRQANDKSKLERPVEHTGTTLVEDLISFSIVLGLLFVVFKYFLSLFRK